MVDFPEPLSPTKATYYPSLIVKERSLRARVLERGYLKVTFLNSIAPEMFPSSPFFSSTKG